MAQPSFLDIRDSVPTQVSMPILPTVFKQTDGQEYSEDDEEDDDDDDEDDEEDEERVQHMNL